MKCGRPVGTTGRRRDLHKFHDRNVARPALESRGTAGFVRVAQALTAEAVRRARLGQAADQRGRVGCDGVAARIEAVLSGVIPR